MSSPERHGADLLPLRLKAGTFAPMASLMGMRRLLLPLVALLALAAAAPADAARYLPPGGKAFHCGIGGYKPGSVGAFTKQAGSHPAVYQYFVSWRARSSDLHWMEGLLRNTEQARSRTMLHVSTSDTALNPRKIARGRGDRFLVALNRLLGSQTSPTYIRLMSEMNNGGNPYAAYDLAGRSRGPAYSTGAFKRAWRRTTLILRGGSVARVNRRLRRLRMPPVRAESLERPRVAMLWVPLTFGNPEIARNHPVHWWPGSRYVDWVGSTWYSKHPNAAAFSRFYANPRWRRKPFALSEYGVWGREDPGFVHKVHRWARSHRVKLLCYYQGALFKPEFRLSTHPRSRGALRGLLKASWLTPFAPEFR